MQLMSFKTGLLYVRGRSQRRSVGGGSGVHMSPGAKVQGCRNGACKNFTTRVKSRSQARLHRRQTSSDSSRLVRTGGEGGAKRDTGKNDSSVARRQVGARVRGRST